MSLPQPAPEERALCAVHADTVAVFTCTRCGAFGCPLCWSTPEATLCRSCAGHSPTSSAGLSLGALFRDTFRQFFRNLQAVGIVAAVFAGIPLVTQTQRASLRGVDDSRLQLWVLAVIVLCLGASAGFIHWVGAGIRDRRGERSAAEAGQAALRRFVFLGVMGLFYGVLVTIGLYLLVLPGAYLALCMVLAPAAVVLDGHGPYGALRHSYELVRGHRLKLLGLFSPLLALFIGTAFLNSALDSLLSSMGKTGEALGILVTNGLFAGALCLIQVASVVAYVRISANKDTATARFRR